MAQPPKNKKQLIFEEAAKLFQEKGYNAASMRDLADRVNLKASSLYSHIRKKEEILQKICFDNAHRFVEGIDEIEKLSADPVEQVQELIRLHIRIALENPTSVTVFNDEWKHLEEPFLSDFLELRKNYESRFKAIIQKGIETGQLKTVNSSIALFTLITSVRWLHYWNPKNEALSRTSLESDILNLLLGGLRNPNHF